MEYGIHQQKSVVSGEEVRKRRGSYLRPYPPNLFFNFTHNSLFFIYLSSLPPPFSLSLSLTFPFFKTHLSEFWLSPHPEIGEMQRRRRQKRREERREKGKRREKEGGKEEGKWKGDITPLERVSLFAKEALEDAEDEVN